MRYEASPFSVSRPLGLTTQRQAPISFLQDSLDLRGFLVIYNWRMAAIEGWGELICTSAQRPCSQQSSNVSPTFFAGSHIFWPIYCSGKPTGLDGVRCTCQCDRFGSHHLCRSSSQWRTPESQHHDVDLLRWALVVSEECNSYRRAVYRSDLRRLLVATWAWG